MAETCIKPQPVEYISSWIHSSSNHLPLQGIIFIQCHKWKVDVHRCVWPRHWGLHSGISKTLWLNNLIFPTFIVISAQSQFIAMSLLCCCTVGRIQQHILIVNICVLIGRGRHSRDKAVDWVETAARVELMRKRCVLLINYLSYV